MRTVGSLLLEPSGRVQQLLFDAVLGVAVFGTVAATIAVNIEGDRDPEAPAYLWAFVLGGLMLVRRRFPLSVLAITVLGLWAYDAAGYPVIGLSVPTAAALYSAAEFRRVGWAASAAIVLLGGSYFYRLVIAGQDPARILGYELAGHVALMTAAIALGLSMRLHRQLQQSTRRLVEATAERERSQVAAAVATERADIARELHDSLGHRVAVVSMHLDVAREALDSDRQTASDALGVAKHTSGEMMTEMRATVGMLRRSENPRVPADLYALDGQVFSRVPVTVHADIHAEDEAGAAPVEHVQAAAYRIIQEALTNVVKHSQADSAEVTVFNTDHQLHLMIRDPGPARHQPGEMHESQTSGIGIYGMRERAESLDGELTITADSGFEVRATLPLGVPAAQNED